MGACRRISSLVRTLAGAVHPPLFSPSRAAVGPTRGFDLQVVLEANQRFGPADGVLFLRSCIPSHSRPGPSPKRRKYESGNG